MHNYYKVNIAAFLHVCTLCSADLWGGSLDKLEELFVEPFLSERNDLLSSCFLSSVRIGLFVL